MKKLRAWFGRFFSPGALVILTIAVVTSAIVASLPKRQITGLPMWTFATTHFQSYIPRLVLWNQAHPDERFDIQLLQGNALERRMLAGFLAGTPVAEVIEAELSIASKAFLGPVKDVGFVDLTQRLHDEGIYDQINTPSFSPSTSRGHIFGLPHDVHPVLLAYRSDIVEAAGIDVIKIETWDDYFRIMHPLMRDFDGDGRPDRFLLSAGPARPDSLQIMLLQAGGTFFDANDRPALNTPRNAYVMARMTTWFTGPARVCVDVNPLTASGFRQSLDGVSIATMMPDWLAGAWKKDNPRIGGKLKLMPLPAWEKGGLRTSVYGGTMIGIAKTSRHFEQDWAFVKYLYLAPAQAENLFKTVNIITPVKTLWSQSYYDEPDPFFSGQPSGRLYIQQAPFVPTRSSSPYMSTALADMVGVMVQLQAYADNNRIYDVARLTAKAQELLDQVQSRMLQLIARNHFLKPGS
jgi:arabinosaccharide transport system substrate-binding protein